MLHTAWEPDLSILLNNGLSVDLQDNEGNTPLHSILLMVVQHKILPELWKEKIITLLEAGAGISKKNKNGKSPLELANDSGNKDLIDLINSYKY